MYLIFLSCMGQSWYFKTCKIIYFTLNIKIHFLRLKQNVKHLIGEYVNEIFIRLVILVRNLS